MSEMTFSKRGVQLSVYSDTHTGVTVHADRSGESNTVVTASHNPGTLPGAENSCPEYYSLDVSTQAQIATRGACNGHEYVSDNIGMFLDRATIERIHFATGELLAQSEGMERGAASVRIVCDPREEAKATEETGNE